MEVQSVRAKGKGFQIVTEEEVFHCRRLILACGGKASQKLGSNGSGYGFASSLGHSIVPVVPALTGLKAGERVYKALAGIRTEASLRLMVDGKTVGCTPGRGSSLRIMAFRVFPCFRSAGRLPMDFWKGIRFNA